MGSLVVLSSMVTLGQYAKLGGFGAAAGLLFGLAYWFLWGCRSCAQDSSPTSLVALFVIGGTVMALMWGKDHLRRPRDDLDQL